MVLAVLLPWLFCCGASAPLVLTLTKRNEKSPSPGAPLELAGGVLCFNQSKCFSFDFPLLAACELPGRVCLG